MTNAAHQSVLQKAEQNYVCPKCRGRQPHVREVTLLKKGWSRFVPWRPAAADDDRYLEVTCALCGYTEFYNRAVYLAATAEEKKRAHMAVPAREG